MQQLVKDPNIRPSCRLVKEEDTYNETLAHIKAGTPNIEWPEDECKDGVRASESVKVKAATKDGKWVV